MLDYFYLFSLVTGLWRQKQNTKPKIDSILLFLNHKNPDLLIFAAICQKIETKD